MKTRQWLVTLALLVLALAAVVGMTLTYRPEPTSSELQPAKGKPVHTPAVDESPLDTARALAAIASTPDQQQLDHEAQKVADHEVDLAFKDALSYAASHPSPPTPENKALFERKNKADASVKTDQDLIAQLTKQLAAAADKRKDSIQDQIDVAKAQLELDQDEQDDAEEDLQRAGADPQAKIQKLLDAHEASHTAPQGAVALTTDNAAAIDYQSQNLLGQYRAWSALGARQMQLAQARQAALDKAERIGNKHRELEANVQNEQTARAAAKQQATGLMQGSNTSPDTKQAATAALTSLKHFSEDQRSLADFDKRIQDEQQLADIYANWSAIVVAHKMQALHGILRSCLLIILICLVLYLVDVAVNRFLSDAHRERTRLHTLRVVIRFALQAVAVLFIAFVIFGAPSQTPTVLGLAGAGLTVAMKDFIVAFFGWFVLMGRNGMRVGDYVEINGVAGEVVEINLLRTVLLETGNWTDTGHPTGRKVAFVNSFAIEGHFFNFSTTGQWLWDELQIVVPSTQDPYPIIGAIQKLVNEATAKNARAAEAEWSQATTHYKVHAASAAPAVNLRPTNDGIEVHVRYITRASERYATRTHLYQALVGLLHGQEGAAQNTLGQNAGQRQEREVVSAPAKE